MWNPLRALRPPPDQREKGQQFLRSLHRQMDEAVPPGAVVLLGDSHTYGLITAAIAPLAVKFGVGGFRSDQLLQELQENFHSVRRAARVVVTIGTNDVLQGRDDTIEAHYRAILDLIPSPVLLCTIPPIQEQPLRQRAVEAAHAARRVAAGRCRLLDLHAALSLPDGTPAPGMLWDGVHLTAKAYGIWSGMLRQALAE